MRLNSLEIKKDGNRIRRVAFNNGLSLVTNERGSGRSGNSVGKSTLSRVVDFLFMGSIEIIYIDEEFGLPNEEIEYLFENHNVVADLSFVGVDNQTHQISRNFAIGDVEAKFVVDGKGVGSAEYESSVQKLFFDVTSRRPTVRAIAPKFIRNDSHRMLNTTKFLDKRQGPKDYSELFLYLFGFQNTDLLTQKRDANNLVTRRKRNSVSLNTIVKEQKPKAEMSRYKNDIKALEKDFLSFDYSPEYTDPVARLSELQKMEDSFGSILISIDRKVTNIEKTISLLGGGETGGYLADELKAIYEFAGATIDGAISEFDGVMRFHSNLVDRKKEFLSAGLPDLLVEKEEMEFELNSIYREKEKVFSDMRSKESIANITENLKSLGALRVSLGKLEGLIEQQELASSEHSSAKEELERILGEIKVELTGVYLFESELNKSIKFLTKEIHDDEYHADLNYDEGSGNCALEITGSVSNPEGGKKKAEVIAFDFAYITAANTTEIKRPSFVFHDSIEDIDQRQIDVIFTEAKKLPGQQIISMLSDNLSQEMYEKYLPDSILLLSENDRFFKT